MASGVLIGCGIGALVIVALMWLGHLRRTYVVVTVSGRSMEPTLRAGDRLLVRRVPISAVKRGHIVVFGNRTAGRWIVKRVLAAPGDPVPKENGLHLPCSAESAVPGGQLVVLGDNPAESTDSRDYGYLSAEWLQGVMVRRLGSAPDTGDRAGGDSLPAK
ncbi:signal peptidase I [Nonomuraea sp. NPDC049695]|uniref:signal peptidase I n=1 Tax=Nonomuraea sp. NPDC049695 TaxID=3154734 RepID=UPI0034409757